MDRTGKVDGVYRQMKKLEAVEEIAAEPPALPTGPFRVLVVNPPWHYGKREEDTTQRGAMPYPSVTIDEIAALPVGQLAEEDCVLWLWTTNERMRNSFAIIDAWGFEQKTILTWAKNKMGTGDWLRGQTEHCILAVRGNPVVNLTDQTTLLDAPIPEHSCKTEEFYSLVEALCPGSKCELFARTPRTGWHQHGNQVNVLQATEQAA